MSLHLFVYGTLRRGSLHPMGEWLARHARWLASGSLEGRLYRVSYYPGFVPGEGRLVKGDVYAVDARDEAAVMLALDAFEGCHGRPEDEYRKETVLVRQDDGVVVQALVYVFQQSTAGLEEVPGGDWLSVQA